MLDLFNIAKPQGCDIQTFYGNINDVGVGGEKSWSKPRGVSHIYMMLIGRGGDGDTATTGGGSGGVTVWYGAAQHVPDQLVVEPAGASGTTTSVSYRSRTGLINLLTARFGSAAGGAGSMSANQFTASGFFQSVGGQAGTGGAVTASSTTFLSGGGNGAGTANYGYTRLSTDAGFFQTQPIIVGMGGSSNHPGGIGCGGGLNPSASPANSGGPGMVLIASW